MNDQIQKHGNIPDSNLDNPTLPDMDIPAVLMRLLSTMPEFAIDGEPKPLSGGLMNYVWRIEGKAGSSPDSLIAKWAPPFVASSPNVQLDPNRILIEAKVMKAFSPDGVMGALATDSVRLPGLYALDEQHHLILMEDVCRCPDLETWLREPHSNDESELLGNLLGEFIGKLHRVSAHIPGLSQEFNNPQIQRTRLDVQYGNIQNYASRADVPDAQVLANRAMDFGRKLQLPGKVLIMGDLWPRSVIVSDAKLRIIDWELAHYGKPAQDVGHFSAHLWMLAHRAATPSISKSILSMNDAFLRAYRKSLGSDFEMVFGREGFDESSIHFGCEILARTVGIFQAGYVYEGLPVGDPAIVEAVDIATSHIRSSSNSSVLSVLA